MSLRSLIVSTAQLVAEILAFGSGLCLAVWGVMWTVEHLPDPFRPAFETWWMWFPVVPGSFLLVALLPFPWYRRPVLIGIAAFAVSWSIVGWLSWRIGHAFFFEGPDARQYLPGELFGARNLAFAALGSAVAGSAVARRRWSRRGTGDGESLPEVVRP